MRLYLLIFGALVALSAVAEEPAGNAAVADNAGAANAAASANGGAANAAPVDAPVSNTLITSTRTPTAEAPAFGETSYFKRMFKVEHPKIELQAPVRLADYVQGDKLELSLRNYIELVLANNTDVQIQRLTVEVPRNQILRSHSIFDPVITSTFNATRRETPAIDRFVGSEAQFGADVLSALSQPFTIRGQQMLPTGTLYSVGFDANRTTNTGQRSISNPGVSSNLNLSFSQPLMRNRGTYFTKLPITLARSRLRASEYQIQDQILRTVAAAENAYWDVIAARESLAVAEQTLGLFGQSLKRSQRELELGAISQLEIFQPQAEYANAEIQVTQARFRLAQAEDVLRRQISVDLDPNIRKLPITLTEQVAPPVQASLDRDNLVEKALVQRPDIRAVRQTLDVDEIQIQTATNQLRPDLRLTGQYGSFGRNAYSSLDPVTGRPTVLPGNIGNTLGQAFGFSFPVYGFGLTLTLPLRDRRASADYADAIVNKRLDMLRVRNQEQTVRLEVLNAISQVEQSKASVELAKVALDLAQKRADAEQKKFDLGTSQMFFVLQAQTDLSQANSALVNQTVNYRRNLTTLLRVTGDLLTERGIQTQ
jgi:outer membrane protein